MINNLVILYKHVLIETPKISETYLNQTQVMSWKWFLSIETENSEDLRYRRFQILNGQKGVGLKKVWVFNGIWTPETWPFEIGRMAAI